MSDIEQLYDDNAKLSDEIMRLDFELCKLKLENKALKAKLEFFETMWNGD